tara:strand:- start:1030 stop:1311 length:282 start_codon:yes stop_codon:yes gene_type:complete
LTHNTVEVTVDLNPKNPLVSKIIGEVIDSCGEGTADVQVIADMLMSVKIMAKLLEVDDEDAYMKILQAANTNAAIAANNLQSQVQVKRLDMDG